MRTFFYFCFQTILMRRISAVRCRKHIGYLQRKDDNKEIIYQLISLNQNFAVPLQIVGNSVSVLPLLRIGAGEESPGSAGNSTSENRSCRRRQVSVEENNRRALCTVRVRRWCKRPPASGRSLGCAIWGLQVHVYHRLRASRPNIKCTMEGRMLEPQGDLRSR